jgi:hypothetical protein
MHACMFRCPPHKLCTHALSVLHMPLRLSISDTNRVINLFCCNHPAECICIMHVRMRMLKRRIYVYTHTRREDRGAGRAVAERLLDHVRKFICTYMYHLYIHVHMYIHVLFIAYKVSISTSIL